MTRVMLVDDSPMILRLLEFAISEGDQLEVIAKAKDGKEAVELARKLRPDVIIMDIEMPIMNGIEAMKRIHRFQKIPVIICSAQTKTEQSLVVEALETGAVDVVHKDSIRPSTLSLAKLGAELSEKIHEIMRSRERNERRSDRSVPFERPLVDFSRVDVVIIGASTGGPKAIREIMSNVSAEFPCGIVVVQHMPIGGTEVMASHLNAACPLEVCEAESNMEIKPGRVIIAKSGLHLTFTGSKSSFRCKLSNAPIEAYHKPSIDVAFMSAVEVFGHRVLGILLTGMGKDGAQGLKKLSEAGAYTIAESGETAVVYGMPKAAVEIGAVKEGYVLRLDEIVKLMANP